MEALRGVITALLTPCRPDGSVDERALAQLVRFQAQVGVTGLFVLGTAGQGPMLSAEERRHILRLILAEAGHLKVIAHIGTLPTRAAAMLAEDAAAAGADAIASVPPVYYQPDFASVREYYRKLAAAAPGLPLFAYNNPPATGYTLTPEQAEELWRDGIIAGVKQASQSVSDLHAILRAGVPVWMANAGLNTAALAMGARGSISTITNVLPELFLRLYDAIRRQDLEEARRMQERIDRGSALLRKPIIGALHAACTMRGLPGGCPREPLRLPDAEESKRIELALRELEGVA